MRTNHDLTVNVKAPVNKDAYILATTAALSLFHKQEVARIILPRPRKEEQNKILFWGLGIWESECECECDGKLAPDRCLQNITGCRLSK